MTEYLGYPVLETRPNADVERNALWARRILRLDPGPGAIHVRDRCGFPVPEHNGFAWLLDGRQEISDFRAWFNERRGRLTPFWAPTWRHDLALAAPASAGSDVLVIHHQGYTQYQFPQLARRHLFIRGPVVESAWGEGPWGEMPWGGSTGQQFREVVASVENGLTEELTLDAPLDSDVPLGSMVCFLLLVRLAGDDIELAWHTSKVATAVADFVELPNEVPSGVFS